jgi:hypothetical protein
MLLFSSDALATLRSRRSCLDFRNGYRSAVCSSGGGGRRWLHQATNIRISQDTLGLCIHGMSSVATRDATES